MPSFLDNPEGSLSSFLGTEIGSMISAKKQMARFMAAAYVSHFCAMFGMQATHRLFVYFPFLVNEL